MRIVQFVSIICMRNAFIGNLTSPGNKHVCSGVRRTGHHHVRDHYGVWMMLKDRLSGGGSSWPLSGVSRERLAVPYWKGGVSYHAKWRPSTFNGKTAIEIELYCLMVPCLLVGSAKTLTFFSLSNNANGFSEVASCVTFSTDTFMATSNHTG